MNKLIRIVAVALIGIGALFIGIKKNQPPAYPFKCSSYTSYNLKDADGKAFTVSVAQDLRFYNQTRGYLFFSGQVKNAQGEWIIQRGLSLERGTKIDSDSFRFHIKKISVAPDDNTPNRYFEPLIREFSLDNVRMQLDIINTGNDAYIVGSPFSFLFSCVRY